MRPLHQILHRAVARDHRTLRAGEEIETLVETFRKRRRTHGPNPRRGELDREGKSVEVSHDLDDVRDIVRSDRESWSSRDSTFDEETRRRHLGGDGGTRTLVGNRQGTNPPHLLAGKSEHLSAGGENGHAGTPSQEALGERRDGAAKMLAVVEDQ